MNVKTKSKTKFNTFLSDGLSMNETKVSILIIFFIITIIFALVMYYIDRTIGSNITSIIGWLIASISGVNISNTVLDGIKLKNENINLQIDLENMMNESNKDIQYDDENDEKIEVL